MRACVRDAHSVGACGCVCDVAGLWTAVCTLDGMYANSKLTRGGGVKRGA
jgi:hypothetical protein